MHSVPHLPVSAGSRRFESVDVDGFRVVDAWFPPHAVLERHTHERTCFGVMLDGGFDLEFSVGPYPCTPTTVFTEPLGEGHANRVSRAGAHVVVIQPDPAREELLRPVADLLDSINHFRHPEIAGLARRLGREVRTPGPAAELAIEGLALEILTAARRREAGARRSHRPPTWLRAAREYVHARYREHFRVTDVADAVGVHVTRVARAFRREYGTGIAEYARRLRLEWAADQLRSTTLPLSVIALRAGFADQSHFTRVFRAEVGVTPGRYRG